MSPAIHPMGCCHQPLARILDSKMKLKDHLDAGSSIVILITFVLFFISLFVKGLTHDILLDIGVFLVSVKIIIMSYKNNLHIGELNKQLEEIKKLMKK